LVAEGYCDLHYRRFRRSGSTDAATPRSIDERFWTFVARGSEDACWEWTGGKWPTGYGAFKLNGTHVNAHRVSYELLVGDIPDGLVVDHLCRNRGCVNPAHLEPVTFRENILRGEGAGAHHARKKHCLRGHTFEPPNGYTNKHGHRLCRACDAIRYAARRARVSQLGA
jgi:hypothetical protein